MRVQVQLTETAQPIEHEAANAYTKGLFYCVYVPDEGVYKYPLDHIWRVKEDYGVHV
jgi:hypothetical protein